MVTQQEFDALEARLRALEAHLGFTRPTRTEVMDENAFFRLGAVDGMFLVERARASGLPLDLQACIEARQKNPAIAGARPVAGGCYEVTFYVETEGGTAA